MTWMLGSLMPERTALLPNSRGEEELGSKVICTLLTDNYVTITQPSILFVKTSPSRIFTPVDDEPGLEGGKVSKVSFSFLFSSSAAFSVVSIPDFGHWNRCVVVPHCFDL